jgi:hypothetical protein
MNSFQQMQLDFTRYLRAPAEQPLPVGVEQRRMEIYRDLIYNNIENLIVGVFPVLRSLVADSQWHCLIREFIKQHRCQTPYFLEISEEFLQFLVKSRYLDKDFPFTCELAHYEWIELALDTSEAALPSYQKLPNDILAATFSLSPLAVALHYQYPVHRISRQFKPLVTDPVNLVVYRNRDDKVCFMEVNSLTQRLLYLMQVNPASALGELLNRIAAELCHDQPSVLEGEAKALVAGLCELGVIYPAA